jgi:hypothetical protein
MMAMTFCYVRLKGKVVDLEEKAFKEIDSGNNQDLIRVGTH